MDLPQLQSRLNAILAEEEAASVDWGEVDRLCEALSRELDAPGASHYPEIVAHFLCDSDIRCRDQAYADAQRAKVRRFVITGEYDDSVAIPWWGCLGAVLFIGAVLVWILH